jgi:hypothetical protein
MIFPKRKKTLLERNTRLDPIDENKLKSKTKRPESEAKSHNDSASLLPPLTGSKSKRPFEIAAIDHSKQRAKLIGMQGLNH